MNQPGTRGAPGPKLATTQADDELKLRYAGSLVEQLGAQLYPSATATVAELISNAWDADAKNIWVTIPFGEAWTKDSVITVVDDGTGMTRADARNAYLIVGRKRRLTPLGDRSEGGRKVHGRKGIGKLAAFGTAGILELSTLRDGELTTFRLDYDQIRKLPPTDDYPVQPAKDTSAPTIDGKPLPSGTRVALSNLWLKRALSEDQFVRSMSRRFAIAQNEMHVFINGTPLKRFDMALEFRFPRDATPGPEITVDADGWATETLPSGPEVSWWIGFTEKPLEDDSLQGISVLARGKMAQRPFLFERTRGTEGQLGQEYMVGEVSADWLDEGVDIDTDFIQSNRDQLQIEDDRLTEFVTWGRRRLAWALRERNLLKRAKTLDSFTASPEVQQMLERFTKRERAALVRVAESASKVPEMPPEFVTQLVSQVIETRDDVLVRQLIDEIDAEEEPFQERMWALVAEFGLLDARKNLTIIEGRLETIAKLREAVAKGAREVPEIHNIIRRDAWLMDPRWHLLDDEVDLAKLNVDFAPELDESGIEMDFLFVLQPASPAPVDEVVVVEIKRGTNPDGTVRKADAGEVNKFHLYCLAVRDQFAANTNPPIVRGLMIAQGYSGQADAVRKSLESVQSLRMEFKTWDRVIEETERMHLGWLAVSKRRSVPNAPKGTT